MKSTDLIKYEWRVQCSNLAAYSVFLIYTGLLFYGGFAGKAERDARISVIEAQEAAVSETMAAW